MNKYSRALNLAVNHINFDASECPPDENFEEKNKCSYYQQYGESACCDCWGEYFIKKVEEEK